MLTTPITTPHFHSQVLTLLSTHLALSESAKANIPAPIIPPFNSVDTPLTPEDTISQLVGYVSPWIDLCSPDQLISNLSRQVLMMEISYAAFCGLSNVIIPGPRRYGNDRDDTNGLVQYARAIREALTVGSYIQMAIHFPMYDNGEPHLDEPIGKLAPFAREGHTLNERNAAAKEADLYSAWDTWNMIRSVCEYSSRLSVGKILSIQLHQFLLSLCP